MRLAVLAVTIAVIASGVAAYHAYDWTNPVERNKEGWRVCQNWLDATPEERKKMPDWCEDWSTGDE